MTFYLTALILLVFTLVYGATLYARYKLEQNINYEFMAKKFYEASIPLLKDDETPAVVLELLSFMDGQIQNKNSAKNIYMLLVDGKLAVQDDRVGQSLADIRQFFKSRPELEKSFLQASGYSILAISFQSWFFGRRLRLWLTALEDDRSRERMVVAYRDKVNASPKLNQLATA